MRKWSAFSLLLLSAMLVHGQWAQAPGQTQAGYPAGNPQEEQGQYPQSQYPGNTPAPGQDQQQQLQGGDNPDPADLQHGVARVSIVQGDVNVRRGDNNQLSGAIINAPLVTHDHLETSPGSRAEVQLDAGTLLRLGPDTDLGFADLQYHKAQVQLGLGTVIFRVLPNAATQVEIDTPSVGIRALTQGEYRISVFDNGTSEVTVRNGQLELSGPRGSERLNAGQSVMVRGDASNPEMQNLAESPRDQFDEWSEGLSSEAPPQSSNQYVNADVQGAADLDRYGSWVPSGYGQSWRPQGVSADWSPYSDGQWSYVDYYGWSWIDYSPWGWAPYHYGRWFNNPGYGWCWYPGARGYHSYWSPALVGFFGLSRGLAWVALAPFESFHPWWGRGSYGFGNRGAYGFGSYRNAGFRGGTLSASFGAFGNPHQRYSGISHGELLSANRISGRLPVNASRASFNYSNRMAVPNNHLASVQSRSFFHGNNFSNNGGGRSFGTAPSAANRSSMGNRNSYSSGGSSIGGWQNFGRPGGSAAAPRQSFQGGEQSGWHNFGQPQSNANRYQAGPRYSAPASQQQPRYNYQQPAQRSYSQPNYQQSAPRSYSQPNYQQQQRYSAPSSHQAAPHYSAPSAPRNNGGGNGGGGSRGGGGGGGSHSSGGGGGHHGR